jgi:hypothetical protein
LHQLHSWKPLLQHTSSIPLENYYKQPKESTPFYLHLLYPTNLRYSLLGLPNDQLSHYQSLLFASAAIHIPSCNTFQQYLMEYDPYWWVYLISDLLAGVWIDTREYRENYASTYERVQ